MPRSATVRLNDGMQMTLTDEGKQFVLDIIGPDSSSSFHQGIQRTQFKLIAEKEGMRDFLDVLLEEPEGEEDVPDREGGDGARSQEEGS